MKNGAENEEILIEDEDGADIEIEPDETTNSALTQRLKKLRTELQATRKERDDNLAGWQRAKADLANYRRTVEEDREKYNARAKGTLIESLLPALDAFDAAMQDSSWENVEKEWREGVEQVAKQLHKTLQGEGLVAFGAVGDTFDPNIHECMSTTETEDKKKDDTIAQVLQQGYLINEALVRPAKVVVAQVT
jgi:molecular chaperone GrpE